MHSSLNYAIKFSSDKIPVKHFNSEMQTPKYSSSVLKVVFLGETRVGKTELINRSLRDKFNDHTTETISAEYGVKNITLEKMIVKLQLWDTGGKETLRFTVTPYIRDSSVAVVVYDITSVDTFKGTDKWIEDVRTQRADDVVIVLVGNKTDLEGKRQVAVKEGEKKAREMDLMFVETSAKSGHNVENLFRRIAQSLKRSAMQLPVEEVNSSRTCCNFL